MKQYFRLIGIDVGKKRIGLAQSDLLQTIASPIGAFSGGEIFEKIEEIVSQAPVKTFVVGWPVLLNGDEGESVHMVKSFIGELKKMFPDIEIVTLDERFTSVMAKQAILESGTPRKKRREKGRVDAAAAAIILQNYLDTKTD